MMLISFLLILHAFATNGWASNSYEDCLLVASKFSSTISNGPVPNIVSTKGTVVKCAQLTGLSCPGQIIDGACTWERKLSVTCSKTNPVRIRVQSNGLPGRCSVMPSTVTFAEINIDFEVNFNPDVSLDRLVHAPKTQTELDNIVCNIRSQSTAPYHSALVSYSTMSLTTVAGVAIDNVVILNANMAGGGDPFHPPPGSTTERVDACLGHCQAQGIYHYHMASGCMVSPPSGNINSCSQIQACSKNMSAYSITTYPNSAKTLTIIGIAKDGHIIYGPFSQDNYLIRSGTDICNGMFHDAIGNYGYFATEKFPYITGCFGPTSYPNFGPTCTTNGPSSYVMSSYASKSV